ncbi:MAG: FimB/Mfa2 family fimbrial subunit [Bacteroidales bacterium]|nr:FimB/Mfa2 family fimbrial subunit [Bacteroidales bacterium]
MNKLLLAIFTLATAFTSCDTLIYDQTDDCPQGVYLKYYAQSTCDDTLTTFYNDFGKAASLTIFAFNQNDKLVSWRQVDQVDLTQDYHYLYEIQNGNYYFHTWVNATKADLTRGNFEVGVTTPTDLGFALRKDHEGTLVNIDTAIHIWEGRSDSVVFLPDPNVVRTEWFDTVATSLEDQTKKVRVTLEGLHPDSVLGMQVYLEKGNYSKELDGTPWYTARSRMNANYRYLPGHRIDVDSTSNPNDYIVLNDSTVSYDFKTLTLYPTDVDRLVIKTPSGTTLWDKSLGGTILLRNDWTGISLNCDYKFHVRFRVRSYNYLSVDVMIGPWIVHSYETDLRI